MDNTCMQVGEGCTARGAMRRSPATARRSIAGFAALQRGFRLLPSTQVLLPDACSIETRPSEPFEGARAGRAVQQVRHTT